MFISEGKSPSNEPLLIVKNAISAASSTTPIVNPENTLFVINPTSTENSITTTVSARSDPTAVVAAYSDKSVIK